MIGNGSRDEAPATPVHWVIWSIAHSDPRYR
jgi:hypothetical protein